MSREATQSQLWIGLIKVKQNDRNGVLGNADQAYSNAIGFAKNKYDFRLQIKRRLKLVELQLLRLENPEPLETRLSSYKVHLSSYKVHKDLIKLAKEVNKDKQVAFDVFATFDKD